jgi:hypothetical protein
MFSWPLEYKQSISVVKRLEEASGPGLTGEMSALQRRSAAPCNELASIRQGKASVLLQGQEGGRGSCSGGLS